MRKERVFIDSSVTIAALLSSTGASFHILNDLHDKLTIQINEYSIAETKRVFLKLPKKFKDDQLVTKLLLLIGTSGMRILPDPDHTLVKRMEKYVSKNDAAILALAMVHSDYLLTLDNGFLTDSVVAFARKHKVFILKPKDFIGIMNLNSLGR
jgi:predicted nucleic acid-binding protein